jgi:hypothetical protein
VVKRWDPATGKLLQTLPHDEQVFSVAFAPAGWLLASGGSNGGVTLWRSGDQRLNRFGQGENVMNRTPPFAFFPILLVVSLLLPGGRTCPAQTGSRHEPEHERLDELVACVVDDMHDWLSKQNVREITVANVQSPPNCASSGVLQSLTDELKLQKVTYKRNARYQLWGQSVSQRTGVITAQFCLATPAGVQVASADRDSLDKRTVIGQKTEQASEVRSWTGDATAPVATIAIRYDKKQAISQQTPL